MLTYDSCGWWKTKILYLWWPGAIQKNSAYSICIRFFRVLPFLHHYFSHPQNQPNLAIHYNNYRCCKILCSILANRKKETIKKEITKTKFGLETNKDEMYYSVFENGSRNIFFEWFSKTANEKKKIFAALSNPD